MMTSSNGNFSALLAICAGNSPVPGEFPTQRSVTRSFDVYFDRRPNKWLSKQSWGWWFETLLCSLWRHRNVVQLPRNQYNVCCITHLTHTLGFTCVSIIMCLFNINSISNDVGHIFLNLDRHRFLICHTFIHTSIVTWKGGVKTFMLI